MFNLKTLTLSYCLISGTVSAAENVIYLGETAYAQTFVCQKEEVAREILNSWQNYGELTAFLLSQVSIRIQGDDVPTNTDCYHYGDILVPLEVLASWKNLPSAEMSMESFISIDLVKLKIFDSKFSEPLIVYGLMYDLIIK